MKTYFRPVTQVTDYQASYMLMADISNGGSLLGVKDLSYEPPFNPIEIY
ncbi:MAG: hypothetical protein IJT35_00140 [Paludibacteraceae bacterium]|jgi:hypothetical protein|nr:hypothetical protein [Paludibacteraceae bacterium]